MYLSLRNRWIMCYYSHVNVLIQVQSRWIMRHKNMFTMVPSQYYLLRWIMCRNNILGAIICSKYNSRRIICCINIIMMHISLDYQLLQQRKVVVYDAIVAVLTAAITLS